MESSTILMMVIVLGILWGGFAGLMIRSMQVEKRRMRDGTDILKGAGFPVDETGDSGGINGT